MTDSAYEQTGRPAAREATSSPAISKLEDPGRRLSTGRKPRTSAAVRTRRVIELKPDFVSRGLYYLMIGLLRLLSLLPDFVLYPLCAFGGMVGYRLDRRHVKIGLKNLELAFPEYSADKRRQILRASYVNLGRSAAEYIRLGGFFYRRLKTQGFLRTIGALGRGRPPPSRQGASGSNRALRQFRIAARGSRPAWPSD